MTTTTTTTRPPPVTRSYSTPDEHTTSPDDFLIRSKTPPTPTTGISSSAGAQNKNGNGKMVAIKVLLLDDSVTIIQAQSKTLGRLVFTQICKQLNILESDYFGLEYLDTISNDGITHWLDLEKRLSRQVGLNLAEPFLKFSVKFYTPDPSQLEEEFTRYLFSLQIKRDLAKGVLVCNDNTAALMASFIVQAECGDFSEEDYADASYLSVYKFVPHQNYELERKIRECHKKHISQSPAEADLHLLETARRTEMYGIRLHPARDEDGVHLSLSVCHMGVLVFQNNTKINTFSWAKIRKISFKRKRFILKLHPETYGYYKELVEFIFDSRNECKAYWKRCVEHHAFFRCEKAPNPIHRSKGILSSRGSSFRYSGRTQKQMVQFVRENFIKRPPTSASGGQYLSQQNLSTFENQQQHGHQGGRNFQGDLFQRSSSFKKYDPKSPLTSAQPTRRSTGNIDFDSRNLTHDDGDELDDDDEEFSDYHIDSNQQLPPCPPSTQQSLSLRNQQKTQQQQSPTGSSITSSPIPQNNHPHPHSTQPMESTEGNNINLSDLEERLLAELMNSDDNSSHNSSSKLPIMFLSSSQNEFPVTSYKTTTKKDKMEKVLTKRKVRKRTKNKPKIDSQTLPKSNTKRSKKEFTTSPLNNSEKGSYDLLELDKSPEAPTAEESGRKLLKFEEVDIPYLLRRRIDLDSGNKILLGKSKSCSSTGKWFEKRLVTYCSLGDLPTKWSFGWRDDSVEQLVGDFDSSDRKFKISGEISDKIQEVKEEKPPEITLIHAEVDKNLTDIKEESTSSECYLSQVAERVVEEVLELACNANNQKRKLDMRDSFQKMQSLDGIEELPLDETGVSVGVGVGAVLEIMNEIIDEENDENRFDDDDEDLVEVGGIEEELEERAQEIIVESPDNTNSPSTIPTPSTSKKPPPPPAPADLDEPITNAITPLEPITEPPPPPPPRESSPSPPPPPLPSQPQDIDYNIETPRYPPPITTDSSSRRSSYDSTVEIPLMPSSLLKKALMRSFSISEEEPSTPPPIPPAHGHAQQPAPPQPPLTLPIRSSSLIGETIEEEFEYIDASEPLYDSIPVISQSMESSSSSLAPQIHYKTRFRTLSRISECHSNSVTESLLMLKQRGENESTLDAPLVTLTSELADSSATLNDLEDIPTEEGDFYVEGVVLDEVGVAQVGEIEELSYSSGSNTVLNKRVCIELRVFGGEITVDDKSPTSAGGGEMVQI